MKKDGLKTNMFYGAGERTFRAASILRKNTTMAEKVMWKKLRDRKLFRVKFRRQHPVDMFIVDFYCHEIKLAIEIDGGIHNSKVSKEYDSARQNCIECLGLTVIRFSNHEVFFEMDSVLSTIHTYISNLPPPFRGAGGL